jgi:hypothetical protein
MVVLTPDAEERRLIDALGVIKSAATSDAWLSPASYWSPPQITTSAWLGHAPFAYWIMDAARPRSVVELGTHYGFSYFVFCEAIVRLGLESTAFALDTWQGDDHAGLYGEEVYDFVSEVNDRDYSSFSRLLRGYFDDSLSEIPDGSVDLLHIDGRHGLEDVTHDFNAWLPKLSSRGVVLLHDIAEHQPGFGVWQFWETMSQEYPSFAFEHSHGLGVLGVGADLPERLVTFFKAAAKSQESVRATYAKLGSGIEELASLHQRVATADATLHAEIAARDAMVRARDERISDMEAELGSREAELEGLRQQLAAVHDSTSWKVTRPLRAVGPRLKRR